MALGTAGSVPARDPKIDGRAFVDQYYSILRQAPEKLHSLYQDSSVISWPGPNGEMTSVSTVTGINDKILSLNYKDFEVEIMTVDTQVSHEDGQIVLVTGCLTGKDNMRRKFTQSFFLAPKNKSFFVLNDIIRYMDENISPGSTMAPSDVHQVAPTVPLPIDAEPTHVPNKAVFNHPTTLDKDAKNGKEVLEQSENGFGSTTKRAVATAPLVDSRQKGVSSVTELASSNGPADAAKTTYASIVKLTAPNAVTTPVHVPVTTVGAAQSAPTKAEQQKHAFVLHEAATPGSKSAPESNKDHSQVKGYSIHVKNLPMDAIAEDLEKEFKKFGQIKYGGIQVRSYKHEGRAGYCFGFVEFESLNSMQSAIEASPITIGGFQAIIEEKRPEGRGGNGSRKFPRARGGSRNDSSGGGRGHSENYSGVGEEVPSRKGWGNSSGDQNDNAGGHHDDSQNDSEAGWKVVHTSKARANSGRGHGNSGRGSGYGRNDFGNQEFSGRSRGPPGRNGEAYHRAYQNGGGTKAC